MIAGRSIPVLLVLAIAAVVWIGMTLSVVAAVIQSPAQNAGLGFGVLLVWIVLIAFALLVRRAASAGTEDDGTR